MKNILTIVSVFFYFLSIADAIQGIDTSRLNSIQTYECILANGFTFAIVQTLKSDGTINLESNQNLKNAKSVGLITDVYIYPYRGKSQQQQINTLFSYIDTSLFRTIWINVQTNPSPSCSWNGYTEQQNCNYLIELIDQIRNKGKTPGIYSSFLMWKNIFGISNRCRSVANQQLWYINYDNKAQFQKFQKFGGWTNPNIKQYKNNAHICGAQVNENFYHFY